MRNQARRWIGLLCALALMVGLAVVPAWAAMPLLGEAAQEIPEEVPAEVGTMRPQTGRSEEAAVPAASQEDYVHDFTQRQNTTNSFYAINESVVAYPAKRTQLTGDYAKYTHGILLAQKQGDVVFTPPSDGKLTVTLARDDGSATGGTLRVTYVHPGANKAETDKIAMAANPRVLTVDLIGGVEYSMGADNSNIYALKLEYTPAIPPCENHQWGSWSEDSATCTETGTMTRTCEICGETDTVETPMKPHTSVPFEGTAPTCSEPGQEGGTMCSVCETILTGGDTIPATGNHTDSDNNGECDTCGKLLPKEHEHRYTKLLRTTATCTASGTETWGCEEPNCDATQQKEVNAQGHAWENVQAKEATCTTVGWNAHRKCSRCQEKENYTEIPAKGHDFDPVTRMCRNGCGTTMDSAEMNAGGWFETLYAEIDGVSAKQVTQVVYSGPLSGALDDDGLEYLVRDADLADGETGVRIDIPGLPAGTYSLLVTTSGNMSYTATGIEVMEYDRSGYAHWNYTEGVGAYRDDGILKENAIVLYVTDENKNDVSVTAPDGTTVTGIGNILNTAGMDSGGGKTSKGGKANTNQDILKKLAQAEIPLVVRIVGNVTDPEGTTVFDSLDYGGTVGDNGGMARMKDARDVTVEGIGTDACMDGWGLHFMASKGYPNLGESFEVRNLSFRNVPEDCIGMEGQQEGSVAYDVERGWVHNCAFYVPNITHPAESDKAQGDGACDFKRGQYFTMDYCYYEGYHKTNLIGSGDSEANGTQHHITWHHNYYKNCESRGPLDRKANVHIYNCIFENQISYAMNPRVDGYIFSEYNSFQMCKAPRRIDAKSPGTIKSYNDALRGCIEDTESNSLVTVTDRKTTAASNNLYKDFEMHSEMSYIPNGDYKLDKDHITARANVLAYAGPMKAQVVTPEEVDASVVLADRTPTGNVALPFNEDMGSYISASGTKGNIVFNISGVSSGALKFGKDGDGTTGQNIVFQVGEPFDITMTGSGIALVNEAGAAVMNDAGTATDLPAGVYFIEPNNMQPGKDGGPATWKDGTLSHLTITAAAKHVEPHVHSFGSYVKTREATCTMPGLETARCSCGETDTREIPKIGHHYVGGACEMCGLRESVGYNPDASGQDTPEPPSVVAVTGITMEEDVVYVDQGSTVHLSATVEPSSATNKSVTWAVTENPEVASVVATTGLVTGKTPGTATITATTRDGGYTATCTVHVTGVTKTERQFVANDYTGKTHDGAVTEADKTEIETKTKTETKTENAFTLDPVGGTWRIGSNKTYLTTAAKGGSALVFSISNPTNTVKLELSSTGGGNYSVVALLDGDGQRVDDTAGHNVEAIHGTGVTTVTFENLPVGTYKIVSPDVTEAEVAQETGVAATGFGGRGVGIHVVTITETQREDDDRVLVSSVTLSASSSKVEMGKTLQINAAVLPAEATVKTLTWSSSRPQVATVSTTGLVTGVGPGETVITATARDGSGKRGTYTVTVEAAVVDSGNLGATGQQVTWTLDSTGTLRITNTDNHLAAADYVFVSLWGADGRFQGVKLIRADRLAVSVGKNWDHMKLLWLNHELAPKCDDVEVEAQ